MFIIAIIFKKKKETIIIEKQRYSKESNRYATKIYDIRTLS